MEEKTFDPVAVTRRLWKLDPSTAPARDREWGLLAIDRLACWHAALRAELFNACQNAPPEPEAGECGGGEALPGSGDDAAAGSVGESGSGGGHSDETAAAGPPGGGADDEPP